MASSSWERQDRLQCERFLEKFQSWDDPSWGFYVYGTYTRTQEPRDTDTENDEDQTRESVDDVHFQTVLSKLHAHAADTLRYEQPAPYNQRLIDTLRLEPAAYLPGASLGDVCTHFRQHHAIDPFSQNELSTEAEKCGPKFNWCLVIDDKSLESVENGPEPIGLTPPEGAFGGTLTRNADEVFVKLLSKEYTEITAPEILTAQGRGGTGRTTEWQGWLKFSPVMMMQIFEETDSGDIETLFEDPDELVWL